MTLKSTVANLKASYEAQLANMNEDRGKTEVGLRARLKVLEEELQKLIDMVSTIFFMVKLNFKL